MLLIWHPGKKEKEKVATNRSGRLLRLNQDRILITWKEIASVTPWADRVEYFRKKWGGDMRKKGYVMSEVFTEDDGRRVRKVFSWESLVKAYFARRSVEALRRKEKSPWTEPGAE
jgi:hypothetical protein